MSSAVLSSLGVGIGSASCVQAEVMLVVRRIDADRGGNLKVRHQDGCEENVVNHCCQKIMLISINRDC